MHKSSQSHTSDHAFTCESCDYGGQLNLRCEIAKCEIIETLEIN